MTKKAFIWHHFTFNLSEQYCFLIKYISFCPFVFHTRSLKSTPFPCMIINTNSSADTEMMKGPFYEMTQIMLYKHFSDHHYKTHKFEDLCIYIFTRNF